MAQINNRRIFNNTMVLYMRTGFSLLVSLLTSRVTLRVLGVEDYGLYNLVGGIVVMLHVVTNALSKSASRYIVYEMGKGRKNRLNRIFSVTFTVQLIMGFVIIFLGETLGLWFVNTQLVIPPDRMFAANVVYQFSLLSFFVALTQVPYEALIVGHERMKIFAYISIIDNIFRLIIVYALYITPIDKLISLSLFGFIVSISIRMWERYYCIKNFKESHFKLTIDKPLIKEMISFSGWSFLNHATHMINVKGLDFIINIFFGLVFNAARALASSIQLVIMKFVNDFTTAMSPQITKSYAAKEFDGMNVLVCRGSRIAYYLLFVISLPMLFEAYQVLHLWLGLVPAYTVTFFRLAVINSLISLYGRPCNTAIMASGKIKWYTITTSSISVLIFVFTYIAYKIGAPVETCYYIATGVAILIVFTRLQFMRHLWNFPIKLFITRTIIPTLKVTAIAIILPALLYFNLEDSIFKSIIVMLVSFISAAGVIYLIGLDKAEKNFINEKVRSVVFERILRRKGNKEIDK